jgi:3-carboxy-cis,cis-muconate cycloisomerase
MLRNATIANAPMQDVFSDHATLQRMLDFEAALARAEAQVGVIPSTAVQAIVSQCDASLLDMAQLAGAASAAGNLAIPLVKQLTSLVARTDAQAAKFVHWGATSQDAIDTGLVLQLRDGLEYLDAELAKLADDFAKLADTHRHTTMVGRTWMQHALPVTFGLKAAGWLDAVLRHQDRLSELQDRVLVLQFGGAAGTLASLGEQGLLVARAMADDLQIGLPDTPWHAQRDRLAEVGTVLGLMVGTLGKIARDISLQMQTEVGEVAEPVAEGRGGSSTMPHKRNPVGCAAVLTAAVRVPALVSTLLSAMVQEHERALGGWQAEWETLPEILRLTAGALEQMRHMAAGLTVDAARMRANLEITHGQIMAESVTLALGAKIGRMQAHQLVEKACHHASAQGLHLGEVLRQDSAIQKELRADELDRLLDPATYLGQANAFVDRVLQAYQQRQLIEF